MPNDITTLVFTSHWWLSSQHSVHNEHARHTRIHMHLQQKPSTLTNCFQLSNLCWLQIPLTSNNNNHRFKAIMRKKSPQGFHQTTTITTMFPLRLCGGRLLVEAMRERRYGPSRADYALMTTTTVPPSGATTFGMVMQNGLSDTLH